MSTLNKELLLRLIAERLMPESPYLVGMEIWKDEVPCGTVACIGGHLMLMSGFDINEHGDTVNCMDRPLPGDHLNETPDVTSARLLGLERYDCCSLFYVSNWSANMQAEYFAIPGTKDSGKYSDPLSHEDSEKLKALMVRRILLFIQEREDIESSELASETN